MELTLALPLGLLMSGAVPRERRLLYGFAVAMMGIALIMTGSRGGMISLVAEVFLWWLYRAARLDSGAERKVRKNRKDGCVRWRCGWHWAA
jgi:hypothetical protein